ncbi:MAG: VWA domain-containing protein, partial [Kiritimatiellae bacterium]|nr:VWA domain-containing protein [Kiritimatiellia bacterium]
RLPENITTWRKTISIITPALYIAGLSMVVITLARPRTILSRTTQTSNMIAIEMVVDVSGSMDALDMSKIVNRRIIEERTRLDVVKTTFAEFVKIRQDDLIGLVSFGGYASTRSPLTTDHDALLHTLKGIDTPKASTHGNDPEEWRTAVGDALTTACARIQHSKPESKIIVLLSDGESNTGIITPAEATEAAKKMGIKIYTIGIGTTGRAPMKTLNVFNMEEIRMVDVVLDEELLQNIATTTGGHYFNVKNPKGLAEALEQINKLEKTKVEKDIYHNYNELFIWFLCSALVLLILGVGTNITITRRII